MCRHRLSRLALPSFVMGLALVPGPAHAQQANNMIEWNPFKNSRNLAAMYAPLISPEVHDDRKVTFRVQAPEAKGVVLTGALLAALPGANKFVPLHKGADGVWSVTVGPVPSEVYVYRFNIDGAGVADPSNTHARSGNQPPYSEVIVPGDGPAYYDVQLVPHGLVTQHIYNSDVVGGPRDLLVYTPPGYERGRQRYPVMYLMGGSGEMTDGWFRDGRVNNILDNLIAGKRAQPMIVVCLNNQMTHRRLPESASDWDAHSQLVAEELRKHVVPLIDRTYRTQAKAGFRALAGLSMGARHTQFVGLRNLDLFSSLGILSGSSLSLDQDDAILADPRTAKKLRLVFVGQGRLEGKDRTQGIVDLLQKHKIPFAQDATGGQGHDWSTWRHLMHAHLLPHLFR